MMKTKDFVLSIILYAFLGYLWITFSAHIVKVANSMGNVFVFGGIIILIGTILFGEIIKRITPLNEYKISHPIKIVGIISFGVVVIVSFYFPL